MVQGSVLCVGYSSARILRNSLMGYAPSVLMSLSWNTKRTSLRLYRGSMLNSERAKRGARGFALQLSGTLVCVDKDVHIGRSVSKQHGSSIPNADASAKAELL